MPNNDLVQAIKDRNAPRALELIENINVIDLEERFLGGTTLLHGAATMGLKNVCVALINKGANINATDKA